jgi:hypothetical protein
VYFSVWNPADEWTYHDVCGQDHYRELLLLTFFDIFVWWFLRSSLVSSMSSYRLLSHRLKQWQSPQSYDTVAIILVVEFNKQNMCDFFGLSLHDFQFSFSIPVANLMSFHLSLLCIDRKISPFNHKRSTGHWMHRTFWYWHAHMPTQLWHHSIYIPCSLFATLKTGSAWFLLYSVCTCRSAAFIDAVVLWLVQEH